MRPTKRNKYISLPSKDVQNKHLFLAPKKYYNGQSNFTYEDNLTNRLLSGLGQYEDLLSDATPSNTDGLFDYQVDDVTAMMRNKVYLNANKMGTGKTIETIVAMRELQCNTILIVAPKPVLYQWATQIAKWWSDRADDIVVRPTKIEYGKISILNYDQLILSRINKQVDEMTFDLLVIDEAHAIKNSGSKRTQACLHVASDRRIALTGTPILKNPDDLYSILTFLDQRITSTGLWNFVYYYCNVIEGMFGKEIRGVSTNPDHVRLLNKLLNTVSCRQEVKTSNGAKFTERVPLVMSTAQARLYKNFKNIVLEELPENVAIPNGAVLLTRCIQATTAPSMYIDSEKPEWGAKFEWLLNLLESNPTEKVLVYSKYTSVLNELTKYLDAYKVKNTMYSGQQTGKVQIDNKNKFINDEDTRVLMGTIKALGVGVDGLQSVCNTCVFLDWDWSPAINEQCEDRLYRTGQDKHVTCYYLECMKSCDPRLTKVNLSRADSIRQALGG